MTDKNELFTRIAREHFHIETLEVRGRDHLDFHDVGVVGIRRALDAAYRAGQADLLVAVEALVSAVDAQADAKAQWQRLRRAIRRARKN